MYSIYRVFEPKQTILRFTVLLYLRRGHNMTEIIFFRKNRGYCNINLFVLPLIMEYTVHLLFSITFLSYNGKTLI